tara:strand:- start:868 stop:2850 length:1983 start_codon:yes stop_codon:yes gene_type:complete
MSLLSERMAALEAEDARASQAPATLAERMSLADKENAPEAAAQKPERTTGQDILGGVNAFGQGASFGFADEVGSGLAAAVAKLTGSEENYGDIYNQMMQSEQNKRTSFADANPKTNLGLNVAGGFLTGGGGGAKVLGTEAVKRAVGGSALKKALAAMSVGSIEGAVAGAGSANQGERGQGATLGATLGALIPAAISGGGQLTKLAARPNPKIAQMLQPNGTRMPLTLAAADDSNMGNFYRKTVEAAYGGGGLRIKAQPFINNAAENLNNVKINNVLAKTSASQQLKASESVIRSQAAAKADELSAGFRQKATASVLPDRMDASVKASILGKNPQDGLAEMDTWMKANAFKDAKKELFSLDAGKVRNDIKKLFNTDPALRTDGQKYLDDLSLDFDDALADSGGYIRGDDLMELRNRYARSANKTADPVQQAAFRTISNKVDDIITEQLGDLNPQALDRYKEDMGVWEGYSTLQKAVGKASNRKGGEFTEDEWLSSTANRKLSKNQGKLQTDAQATQAAKKEVKSGIRAQIDANPLKITQQEVAAEGKEATRLASENLSTLRSRTTKTAPSNATRLIATGILGSPALPVSPLSPFMSTLPVGMINAKALSSDFMQDVLAGQRPTQKSAMQGLERLNNTNNGMTISDILRQGVSAGTVAGLPE